MEGRTFVSIDETGFNTLELRTECRSPVGKRCIQYREKAKIETVTAITAISELSGIEHVTFVEGSVNDQSFRVFLLSLMEKLQSHGRESFLLVMDNVGLHETEAVINLITSKNYGILYTAPNSCELNPIEYVFGMWKARLKISSSIKNNKKLIEHLYQKLDDITRMDVLKCINMVQFNFLPLAHQKINLSDSNKSSPAKCYKLFIEEIVLESDDVQIVPCSSASASASASSSFIISSRFF
ncbi:putative DDE superfamily endonuclease [Monocercomonoides exilis]|uniref:putative DDE superfamily endonuclease n=1 Tax=Monocercomonoides exilis TaxID=2049356 RepID=UPI00355942E8|nr:putative DDE superfamily endonuclease [Monocercomonoides exilis]|eukprot:MONOS_10914.1-p1 / transcript=MONOS_10914.1 / gene=MONOS_10914 / organism=Monocercomonoides_exilis_PA203 / gene_product=unspecified product / transcript_product=unspecified product / location=Mono_scaffold00518:2205-2924(+) / protein_length=239 / sequence_SO=supercontig / SO=protein_coding / is_pseudo=false